jgi:3'-phosphoadenosine 5'-phosphosulfate sulfotransferase (PAPS reductase)/FAD synthetase
MEIPKIDKSSWFYENCRAQRKKNAKVCQTCPFRGIIEEQEKEWKTEKETPVAQEELRRRQSLSLAEKIEMSQCAIETWWRHWDEKVYVSFSGGKDSTVLLHLVRNLFPDVPAVFFDSGLEFPEVKEFVKSTPNVDIRRPKLSFKQVVETYGYPVVSKEQSRYLSDLRTSKSESLKETRMNGDKKGIGKVSKKWLYLVDAPFKISSICCNKLKKYPAHQYDLETGRKPYIAVLAEESGMREREYLKHGCNAFNGYKVASTPLAFWTEKDIWEYIHTYDVPYSKIYDMGYKRTGCIFCMYGVHAENEPNRFQMLKETHPKLYEYCINDLKCGEVLDYMGINYK